MKLNMNFANAFEQCSIKANLVLRQANCSLETAFTLAEAKARLIPEEIYAPWKAQALLRIPRDLDDWPTVVLSLAIDAAIWTSDADFLDCGIVTWTTETLLLIDRAQD
jgi:predicted nucleic acid-binding protein